MGSEINIFILWSLYFVAAAFIALYIPGNLALGKRSSFTLSLSAGLVLWAWQAYILGFLHLRFLTYVYLAACGIIWIRKRQIKIRNILPPFALTKYKVLISIIVIIGVFGQVNRFIPTGFIFPNGIHILTAASDDAFWHGALTNQLVSHFPPDEPGLSGIRVTNYHYWVNMIIAEFTRVFRIPVMPMQFVYAPLLFSLLLGCMAYILMTEIGISKAGRVLGLWLMYFASDVNYLISFVTRKQFTMSVHPLEDGTMFWENPPRAASFVITLLGTVFFLRWIKMKKLIFGILAVLAFGSVIGFKVHTGVAVLGGVIAYGVYALWKREWKTIWIPITVGLLSLIVYLPVNANSGFPIVAPFEMARMYAVQEKLGISFLELRRRIYGEHFNFIRVWQMDLTMLALFFIGQFGIRNIGWFGILPFFRRFTSLGVFLIGGIASSVLFGTLFIQPVAGADIFNAYLATSLFLWVAATYILDTWAAKLSKIGFAMLVILIGLVTLPRWIYKTYIPLHSLGSGKPAIAAAEIEGMTYVRSHTAFNDVVAVFNIGQWDSMYPYVSIYTDRPMYLSGQTILERHGIPFPHRTNVMNMLKTTEDISTFEQALDREGITLLYFYGKPTLAIPIERTHLTPIFSNGTIWVYRNTLGDFL